MEVAVQLKLSGAKDEEEESLELSEPSEAVGTAVANFSRLDLVTAETWPSVLAVSFTDTARLS
jgi:hypothetical protein